MADERIITQYFVLDRFEITFKGGQVSYDDFFRTLLNG
jgi:hypothetical protein